MKMEMKMSKWLEDVRYHVNAYDHDDLSYWHFGPMCEDAYNLAIYKGQSVEGHDYEMPEWLRRQLHFENVVAVMWLRLEWFVGSLWCKVVGHDVEVDESADAESPWVAWACKRCGDGGRSWL